MVELEFNPRHLHSLLSLALHFNSTGGLKSGFKLSQLFCLGDQGFTPCCQPPAIHISRVQVSPRGLPLLISIPEREAEQTASRRTTGLGGALCCITSLSASRITSPGLPMGLQGLAGASHWFPPKLAKWVLFSRSHR